MRWRGLVLAALALAAAPSADAAALAVVEKLRMPAWLEHAEQRTPLAAGTELRAGDRLVTGRQGRLLVQLADGSVLRLGEQGRLVIHELKGGAQEGALQARLELGEGFLRVTAEGAAPLELERAITLELARTRITTRQADLCAGTQRLVQTVCLIQGTLAIEHPGAERVLMEEPGTVFRVSASGPLPLAAADPEMLRAWTEATALEPGTGTTVAGGGWIVQLGAFEGEADAQALAQRLAQAGYAAEITTAASGARARYRVRITQFDSERDAKVFAEHVQGRFGTARPWITCPSAECPKR